MLPPAIERLIDLALDEDLGRGDVTSETTLPARLQAQGVMLAKQQLVFYGMEVARVVFARVDPAVRFTPLVADGALLAPGTRAVEVAGSARSLLAAERTALNFVQRLSGVATLTRRYVEKCAGTRAMICDTRKTTPGWRWLDKEAVRAGGGRNHRADLASGVLIKDNHVAACGSVGAAVERARTAAPHGLRIEVEVTRLDQIEEALSAGAEVVLLDNMTPAVVRVAVAEIKRRAIVEVSGGVNLETVRDFAEAGADLISVGALTHSAPAVDLSLEL